VKSPVSSALRYASRACGMQVTIGCRHTFTKQLNMWCTFACSLASRNRSFTAMASRPKAWLVA
jgi:hypothetical protein